MAHFSPPKATFPPRTNMSSLSDHYVKQIQTLRSSTSLFFPFLFFPLISSILIFPGLFLSIFYSIPFFHFFFFAVFPSFSSSPRSNLTRGYLYAGVSVRRSVGPSARRSSTQTVDLWSWGKFSIRRVNGLVFPVAISDGFSFAFYIRNQITNGLLYYKYFIIYRPFSFH